MEEYPHGICTDGEEVPGWGVPHGITWPPLVKHVIYLVPEPYNKSVSYSRFRTYLNVTNNFTFDASTREGEGSFRWLDNIDCKMTGDDG